jgi:GTPase SAR1 family protein
MIVFDITERQSFDDAINYWFNEIRSSCPANTQLLLVGKYCFTKVTNPI